MNKPQIRTAIIKLTDDCNENCPYCYCRKSVFANKDYMKKEVLEQSIKFMTATNNDEVYFDFHGGEPLLCGVELFNYILDIEQKYKKNTQKIFNNVQTNGILLDKSFTKFFKDYDFDVGVSLDGPYEIHVSGRKTKKQVYDKILKNIEYRDSQGIRTGCISVISNEHLGREQSLLEFYRKYRFKKVSLNAKITGDPNTSISKDHFGQFLCNMFLLWVNQENPVTYFLIFQEFIRWYIGKNTLLCSHNCICHLHITILPNGDIYPCDFYSSVNPKKLGTVYDSPEKIYEANYKICNIQNRIPEDCMDCNYKTLCNGGCLTERFMAEKTYNKKPYYCKSYKKLYSLMEEYLDKYIKKQ